ncbi:MAG: DUF1588 domain-containing protein [Oceanospirillaceae bacterium]|nr:DUF1588 domain-containing protein [Oceanospirillaceae bacterium]
MSKTKVILLFILSMFFVSCTPIEEQEFNDNPPNDGGPTPPDDLPPLCQELPEMFVSEIQPILESNCTNCHIMNGAADNGSVDMLFENDKSLWADIFNREASLLIGNRSRVIVKGEGGASHGGGVQLIKGNDTHDSWSDYTESLLDCDNTPPPPDGEVNIFEGVEYENDSETLYKASIILRGFPPSSEELSILDREDLANPLRYALRHIMDGTEFRAFLHEGINDKIFTDKFIHYRKVYESLYERHFGFSLRDNQNVSLNSFPGASPRDYENPPKLAFALAKVPLHLLSYIVENERDYRELLTARYTVVNDMLFTAEGGGLSLITVDPDTLEAIDAVPQSYTDWKPVIYKPGIYTNLYSENSPLISFPHSGLLTDKAWLLRHPTSSSNLNRHRARMAMSEFLDFDVQELGRPEIDEEDLIDSENPTYFNSSCTGCHEIMDPVAGAFQNFGEWGRFRARNAYYVSGDNREDSLYQSYRSTAEKCRFISGLGQGYGGYCDGDLWMATTVATGFLRFGEPTVTLMPDDGPGRNGAHDDRSLQWLASELTNDPRFVRGTLVTWLEAILNRKVIEEPTQNDPDYSKKLIVFNAQEKFFTDIGIEFVSDLGHGRYNLKDLLVRIFDSNWFRAKKIHNDKYDSIIHGSIGTASILTPEKLHRRIKGALGVGWGENSIHFAEMNKFNRCSDIYATFSESFQESCYSVLYGGIDSDLVTERVSQFNSIMYNIAQRLSVEVSCYAVQVDFEREPNQRILFSFVDKDSTVEQHEQSVRAEIARWFYVFWGESVGPNSSKVDMFLELLKNFRDGNQNTVRECSKGEELNQQTDPNGMMRGWSTLLIVFMTDYKFTHI